MAKRGTRALRTKSGGISAYAHRKFGAKPGGKLRPGTYPVFDQASGKRAINLRGHAPSKKAVLNKVQAFASRTHSATLKAAVKRARAMDRKR